jgi:polysaccharide export outer membrane protein
MYAIGLILVPLAIAAPARAQTAPAAHTIAVARVDVPAAIQPTAGYVIGPDDVLAIVFLYEKELSSDVAVRPDGMISLPLINDIRAAGLTPEQLRLNVIKAVDRFIHEPTVTVVVKQINSRKVFITGKVNKPGVYPLHESTTVLQLIATAGGLLEYADSKNIVIMRSENGRLTSHVYNHNEVVKRKNLLQNIELKSGDTIIVP